MCAGAAAGVAARAAGGGRSRARSGVSGGPLHVCSSSRAAAGAAAEAAAGSRRRFWRPGRRLRGVRSWGAAGAARGRRGAASRRFSAVAPRCMPVGFARWKKVVNRTFFGPQPTPRGKPSHSRPEAHFRLSEHKPTSTHNGHVSNVSGKTNAMLDIPRFLYSHARGVEATKRLETRGSGPGEKS